VEDSELAHRQCGEVWRCGRSDFSGRCFALSGHVAQGRSNAERTWTHCPHESITEVPSATYDRLWRRDSFRRDRPAATGEL